MDALAQRFPLSRTTDFSEVVIPASLLIAFLSIYSIYPNNVPHYDELYHVLAGASWSTSGTLALGDGVYERTPLFTMLVGTMFEAFGFSLAAARLPSILASVAWVVLVYLLARPFAGRAGAAVAAIGLGLCPLVAEIAKMARFYAIHGLLFTAGAFAVYRVTVGCFMLPSRMVGFALGTACLLAAGYFQVTTAIGVAGLVTWLAGWLFCQGLQDSRQRLTALAVASAVAILVLMVTGALGVLGQAFEAYRHTASWAADRANYEGFYLDLLLGYYPVLLPLFPLAAICALAKRPGPAAFCLTIFGVGLVLHTFAGMKTERYITYLMPFFWIIIGIVAGPVMSSASRAITRAADELATILPLGSAPRAAMVTTIRSAAFVTLLMVAWINLAGPQTLQKLIHRIEPPVPVWDQLEAGLDLPSETIVLTANDLHVLYFLGDFHARLGPADLDGELDTKTGRPIVAEATRLAGIVACHERGIVLADAWRWGNPGVVAPSVRTYVERHLDPHPAGPELGLVIFSWDHGEELDDGCSAGNQEETFRLEPTPAP